jgi:hypothetical protein
MFDLDCYGCNGYGFKIQPTSDKEMSQYLEKKSD